MNTTGTSPAAAPVDAKQRLTKKLPTFRVGFQKQMDALRAYAILSDGGTRPVHYAKIAEVIKVHEANVSSMNPFFLENGLIAKGANGYLPNADVLEYNRAFAWNPETAAVRLAPIIKATWFAQELSQRLSFRSLSEDEAIQVLADASHAGPEAKPQLRVLLDFCEATKIIERANGALKLLPTSAATADSESAQVGPAAEATGPLPWAVAPPYPVPLPSSAAPQANSADKSSGAGSMNFDISINVNMAEMRDWTPDRITAFFAGIAQVLAAKNQSG